MSTDVGRCPQCGAALGPNRRFCEQCGARLGTEAESGPAVGASPAARSDTAPAQAVQPAKPADLTWARRVPLLTNRFILWDFTWVLLAAIAGLYLLVAIMSLIADGELLILPWQVFAYVLGILAALFAFTILLVFQNGYNMVFTLGAKGATWHSGGRERNLGRFAFFVGILALFQGRPGLLGSTMIAQSQEGDGIAWRDLYKVKVYPAQRVVSLSNSWRTVLRLYCLPENFAAVRERVETEAAAAVRWRAAHPRAPGNYGWRRRLIYCGLAVVAGLAATTWEGDEVAGFALTAAALLSLSVLIEGVLRRLSAALGLGAVALLALSLWQLASERFEFAYGLIVSYGYEYDTPLLVVATVGSLILCVVGLQRLLWRSPRAVPSGRALATEAARNGEGRR
jgi:hypothetical protein